MHDWTEETKVVDAKNSRGCFIFVFDDADQKENIVEFNVLFQASHGYGFTEGVIISVFNNGNIFQESFHDKELKDDYVVGEKQFFNHPDLVGFCVFIECFLDLEWNTFEKFMDKFMKKVKKNYFGTISEELKKALDKKKCELNNQSELQSEIFHNPRRKDRFVFSNDVKDSDQDDVSG